MQQYQAASYPANARVIRSQPGAPAGYTTGGAVVQPSPYASSATNVTRVQYAGQGGVPTTYAQPQPQAVRTMQGPSTTLAPGRVVQAAPGATSTRSVAGVYSAQGATYSASPTVVRSVQGAPTGAVYSSGTAGVRVVQAGQTGATVVSRVVPAAQVQPQYQGQVIPAQSEVKVEDAQLNNLKELRKTSGLKFIPVSESLPGFKVAAVEGKLTRDQFVIAYQDMLTARGVEVPPDAVINAVFDLFDRDDNGVVDMMELICGISLLCSGSEDEKILAVFNVFDENGDGFISMDEMFKFLTSVFKVVLTPNVMQVMMSMGVTVESAEDLASVTALECFKAADLNHDGKLSVTEFKSWFYAPKNDPSFIFSPMQQLFQ